MDGFDELKKHLLAMNYPESWVDETLSRMRREEEAQLASLRLRSDLPRDQVREQPDESEV